MYNLCFIFQVGHTAENSYPYREVLLTRTTLASPFSFPVFNGEANFETGELVGSDPLMDRILSIYTGSIRFIQIDSASKTLIYLIKDKPHSLLTETKGVLSDSPEFISTVRNGKSIYVFAIMDEVLQGKYCHVPISRVVRDIFFKTDLTDFRAIRPSTPYLYDSFPEKQAYPTEFALVPVADYTGPIGPIGPGIARQDSQAPGTGAEAGGVADGAGAGARADGGVPGTARRGEEETVAYPLHNDKYIRIPFIGYHGTSVWFIRNILISNPEEGLAVTSEKGMYGNNAYYFGNFWKAIRYAFRDSQYSTILANGPLYTERRPSGFIEMPNTAHRVYDEPEAVVDIVRDSPAVVRFVIFLKDSSYLPRELPPAGDKEKIRIIREVPEVTGAGFLTYSREMGDVHSDNTFTEEYIATQVGQPLFTPDDTVESLGIPMGDMVSLVPSPGSTRQEVALRLFRAIHTASTKASEGPGYAGAPFAVIVLKMPGDLPDMTAFSLMTTGFLTDGNPIYGSAITHISEEKIRMMLTDFGDIVPGPGTSGRGEGGRDKTQMVISGPPTLEQTGHRLAMEDLARLASPEAHVLIESYSLPPEITEQIAQICIASGRKLILIRARNDLQAIPSPSQPMIPSKDEMMDIQNIIDINVANLEGLGAKVHTLIFTPNPGRLEGGTIRIKNRICDVVMEESIEITKTGKRVFSRGSGKMGEEYVAEYPRTGGSMRVYPWAGAGTGAGGDGRDVADKERGNIFNLESILPTRWKEGESESLIVEPFRIAAGKKAETEGFNITSHTEIVVRRPKSFFPLSWHLGDLRSLTRHHIPLSVGGRVL